MVMVKSQKFNGIKILAAFQGMHVSPANIAMHDYQESVTDRRKDGQTTEKIIPMCRYASQATHKIS